MSTYQEDVKRQAWADLEALMSFMAKAEKKSMKEIYFEEIQRSLDGHNDIETAQWQASQYLYKYYHESDVDKFLETQEYFTEI